MKKIICLVLLSFLCVGCTLSKNTPINKVDAFLSMYKDLDNEVLDDIEYNTELTGLLNENEKKVYKKVLKRQYANMDYDIKDELINGNNAVVEVEVSVYDLYEAEKNSKEYRRNHNEEFIIESEYYDFLLKNMLETDNRVKYTLTMNLTKKDDKWVVQELNETDIEKLHGMYNYED